MGREVRKIPVNWVHPVDSKGNFIPLLGGNFTVNLKEFELEEEYWKKGLRRAYGEDIEFRDSNGSWAKREDKYLSMPFEEWQGWRPRKEDYMPEWPAEDCVLYVMYESTSEGTPISPPMKTPEELARWLVKSNASAFGASTATYENWLATINRGFAVSAVVTNGQVKSGVEAF